MNILIIRLTSMGDVVLVTSALDAIAQQYPDSRLHLVTHQRYRELFDDDPRLASVHATDGAVDDRGLDQLGKIPWHRVVDLQNNRASRGIRRRFSGGAPVGVLDKLHVQRILLLLLRIDTYDCTRTVAVRYAEAAGVSAVSAGDVAAPRLYLAGEAKGALSALLGNRDSARPTLALMPFSAWRNKRWPPSLYEHVGKHFASLGWNVVVLGGPEDQADGARMASAVGPSCVSAAGARSLKETGLVLSACRLALGGDTGLSHVARACGVRTGIVYGSTTRHFGFFPFGPPSYRVFEASLFCRPCHPHGGSVCWRLSRPCLNRIDADLVITGLLELDARGQAAGAETQAERFPLP